MFKEHPWHGEEFGPAEYEWYLARGYVFNVEFELDQRPFIDYCKQNRIKSNHLMMKIGCRLSMKYLPQRGIAIDGRDYPVRYPAGYIRPLRAGADMLEHIGVHEKEDKFEEVDIRHLINPYQRWFMVHTPRLSVTLGKLIFGKREMKKNYALMISRNPLAGLGRPVVFSGTDYRSFVLTIPYGDRVRAMFGSPHAFGNINYFESFLKEFIDFIEQPETIPAELLDKPYKPEPLKG